MAWQGSFDSSYVGAYKETFAMGTNRHRHNRRLKHQPWRRKIGTLLVLLGAMALLAGASLLFYGFFNENDKLCVFGVIYLLSGAALVLIQRAVFHIGQLDA